jgi:4-diphosphocytidyl-2-C-methyl-D-erythritol kinase
VGDALHIEQHDGFDLTLGGPYAKALSGALSGADNLVTRAARYFQHKTGKKTNAKITLVKNLPPASGMGGGSADAGALLRGFSRWHGIEAAGLDYSEITAALGADVPVCIESLPRRMRGIGEILGPSLDLPDLAAVLVYPGRPCPTGDVFAGSAPHWGAAAHWPDEGFAPGSSDGLIAFLQAARNDLYAPACKAVPEIAKTCEALEQTDNPLLIRMAGSGSTCFALYGSYDRAVDAASKIAGMHPGWWVRAARLTGKAIETGENAHGR